MLFTTSQTLIDNPANVSGQQLQEALGLRQRERVKTGSDQPPSRGRLREERSLALLMALAASTEGSNSCKQFCSNSLLAQPTASNLPPECAPFQNRKGQYVLMLRLDDTFYLYGPHSLDACEHLRTEQLRARHICCDCQALGLKCPDPSDKLMLDWNADIVEIETAWPADIPPLPPKHLDVLSAVVEHEKKLTKPQRALAKELANVPPIAKFAIFRPAFQEPLPPGPPPKKRKPKQPGIAELFAKQ